jgi:rhamnosyltransferase
VSDAPAASVIVRTKNSAGTVMETFRTLREQTIPCEIVVVDSGSTDATLDIAARWADRVVEIAPGEFSFGRALNIGAHNASAPVHFALSSHCYLHRPDYLERSLRYYESENVAATNGAPRDPDGEPLLEDFVQRFDDAFIDPYWGFSNHAASWRASVWEQFPFDEEIEACEDKEWAWRVLQAGHVIVFHPALLVSSRHRERSGTKALFERSRREARALARHIPVHPASFREACRQWWNGVPEEPVYPPIFYRLNYYRAAEIFGRYVGQAEVRTKAVPVPRVPERVGVD